MANPQPRFGPGSRGVNEGRPKAADELARRAAEREKEKESAPTPASSPSQPSPKSEPEDSGSRFGGKFSAGDAGGAVLALVLWSWVILPILQGGPDRMKNVLRAKFLNKDAKGQWLP